MFQKSELSRAYLDKTSPHYRANRQSFDLKMCQRFPPIMSSKKCGSIPAYTRQLVKHDRSEEIKMEFCPRENEYAYCESSQVCLKSVM